MKIYEDQTIQDFIDAECITFSGFDSSLYVVEGFMMRVESGGARRNFLKIL